MTDRPLSLKEQTVVDAFEQARPGLGAIAHRNILNNQRTGWADRIRAMGESEIQATNKTHERLGDCCS